MPRERIEAELKSQLNKIDKRLKSEEHFKLSAWFGTAVGMGLILSMMTVHVVLLLGITIAGLLLNLATGRILPKKRS